MADRPLRPATDHRLGRPLPHQLPNRSQAPLRAPKLYLQNIPISQIHAVLAIISNGYPPLEGRSPTSYSPVRHFQEYKYSFTFDLHVLGTPLAFILSQDQTLRKDESITSRILLLTTTLYYYSLLLLSRLSYHSLIVNVRFTTIGRKSILPHPTTLVKS